MMKRLSLCRLLPSMALLGMMSTGYVTRCTLSTGLGGRAPWFGTRRSSSLSSGGGVMTYPEGQDLGELFDLYDAPPGLGEVASELVVPTGRTKSRQLVHAEGDWHRAVHIWLVDDKASVLLQRRSSYKDTFPLRWDVSCAGHVDAGQDSISTALRELQEELGLNQVQASDLKFLGTLAASIEGSTKRHGKFICNEYQVNTNRLSYPVSPLMLTDWHGRDHRVQTSFLLAHTSYVFWVERTDHQRMQYRFSEGEIAEVKFEAAETLRGKLAARDENYVPRGSAYLQMLSRALAHGSE